MTRLLFALGFVVAVAAGLAAFIYRPPFAGEPVVVVAIPPPSATPAAEPDPAMRQTLKPGQEARTSPTLPEQTTGDARTIDARDVIFVDPVAGTAPPRAGSERLRLSRAPIEGFSEPGEFGPLPKIAADGRKPSAVYARPFRVRSARDAPVRIAISIGGMGISATSTSEAVQKLPGEVTLAFAPYGENLQAWIDRARLAGHEVMLQVPMEPFDYPDNDPGPHTLLTGLSAKENRQRLTWLMGRFTGYFGVTNYMGAKFTAEDDALAPVFADLGARGLAFLDDGASPRSRSLAVAEAQSVQARKADVVLDAEQTREGIAAALRRLEEIAKERGSAIGVGTALPVTLDVLAEWTRTLAARGIALAPVSAVLNPAEG